ncbi:---NA--- [Octopus vulgaris]|uniref:---NA n=1 Tax=Octopus vulgaris TaxID=6645 RepID=A0AA36F8I4_OCTVU|nr:---NA--- [Octopus vulgaris]
MKTVSGAEMADESGWEGDMWVRGDTETLTVYGIQCPNVGDTLWNQIVSENIRLSCILCDPDCISIMPKATKLSEIEQRKILVLKVEEMSNRKTAEKIF